jgi:hypothetical protein
VAFGIRFVKNDQGQWVVVGISTAEQDGEGQMTTGGTSFSLATSPKTDVIFVQNQLEDILKNKVSL